MQSFEQVLIVLLFCLAIVLICQKIKRFARKAARNGGACLWFRRKQR